MGDIPGTGDLPRLRWLGAGSDGVPPPRRDRVPQRRRRETAPSRHPGGPPSRDPLRGAPVRVDRPGHPHRHLAAGRHPGTVVGPAARADRPALPDTPHRWDTVLDSGTGAQSLAASPASSTAWADLLDTLGIVDTAMVPLGDRGGCWGFVELWRTSSPFTAAEIALLATIAPAVTTALRHTVARSFADPRIPSQSSGPAVVVLDDELRVSGQTASAAQTLLALNPPDEPMPPVPAAAYNVGAALLAGEHGPELDTASAPWSRVRVGGSSWMTVRASHLEVGLIAVTIETCTPTERMDLYARACGLSASETAVLSCSASAPTTRRSRRSARCPSTRCTTRSRQCCRRPAPAAVRCCWHARWVAPRLVRATHGRRRNRIVPSGRYVCRYPRSWIRWWCQ